MPNDDTPPKKYVMSTDTGRYSMKGIPVAGILRDFTATLKERAREIFGYTYERQKASPEAWLSVAQSFYCAAEVLNEFRDRIPSDSRPFAFNAALSLELILKAVLTKRKISFPTGLSGHDLRALCDEAQIAVTSEQKSTLELMTAEFLWAARYPVPNKEDHWNQYHDKTFERHIVTSQIGNVTSRRANPTTFPNWENYIKIWTLVLEAYRSSSDGGHVNA